LIFVDSNVPMYLIGAPHPNRNAAHLVLENMVVSRQRLVTDAEVLQEIFHRYTSIGRREAIDPAFRLVLSLVDDVLPVEKLDGLRAG
jgi:uncharacterized protein